MARPNDADAIAGYVHGLREAKAAFQALPEITRERMNDATETTIAEIARQAQSRLESSPSIQTRTLYRAVAFKMNRANGRGRVGIANLTTTITVGGRKVRVKGIVTPGKGGSALTSQGARIMKPSKYGPKVEFGTRHMAAEPFMVPAAKSQERPYLDRMTRAGKDIEKDMAAIGLRNL